MVGIYEVFTAPSGEKLFSLLEKVAPSLILLDIEMPGMDGYEVIKKLKAEEKTANIPVIFLTARHDPESEMMGLDLGAVDYIMKPFSKELLLKRSELHIEFEKQKQHLKDYNKNLQAEVKAQTKTIQSLQNAILKTVAELVERRDSITGGHIERTQRYLSLLLGFLLEHDIYTGEISSWDAELFVLSSQLHDVGKVSIRDSILLKQGRLTKEEYEEMKQHTVFGMSIIGRMMENTAENEFLQFAKIMAVSHHEKWDGSGYPFGLRGLDIPLQGRLMSIVDVYDALTNDRPYKKAFTHEESMAMLEEGAGSHFDPLICEVFLRHSAEFKRAAESTVKGASSGAGFEDGPSEAYNEHIAHLRKAGII
jgi:putative two-component system response regulator